MAKVALLVSALYQKETCATLKAILFRIKLNVITMENRRQALLQIVYQDKPQTLEISNLIAAQVDNGMINTKIKVQIIRLGMQKKFLG